MSVNLHSEQKVSDGQPAQPTVRTRGFRRMAAAIFSATERANDTHSRWVSETADGAAYAAGAPYERKEDVDDHIERLQYAAAQLAVTETAGSWNDKDTLARTTEAYLQHEQDLLRATAQADTPPQG